MNSRSLISMISVLSLCFTISRHIASRSRLFSIPILCNEQSFKRSSPLPVISCYFEKKNNTIKFLNSSLEVFYCPKGSCEYSSILSRAPLAFTEFSMKIMFIGKIY